MKLSAKTYSPRWDIAKKINLLLDDEKLYDKIVKNGIDTAKEYDYSLIAKKYAEIILKG